MPGEFAAWIRNAEALVQRIDERDATQARQLRFQAAEKAFMAATTAQEYNVVRDYLRKFRLADSGREPDGVSIASILTCADAAFLASQTVADGETRKRWIRAALDDLGDVPTQGLGETDVQQLASLAQVVSMMSWRLWPDLEDPEIRRELIRLAEIVDCNVQAELSFPGDEKKTAHVRSILATLSAIHGRMDIAINRWESLLGVPQDQQQFLDWFREAYWEYRSKSQNQTDSVSVFVGRGLRRTLRAQLERYRMSFRSRTGRYWVSNLADEVWGELVSDDIKSGAAFPDLYWSLEGNSARTLLEELSGGYREPVDRAAAEHIEEAERTLVKQFQGDVAFHDKTKDENQESDLVSRALVGHAFGVFAQGWKENEALLRGLYSVEDMYEQHDAGYIGLSQPVSLEEIRSVLGKDELLVHYYVVEAERHPAKEVIIVAIGWDESFVIPVDLSAMQGWQHSGTHMFTVGDGWTSRDFSSLGMLVRDFRLAIRKRQEAVARERSRDLFEMLVTPLLQRGVAFEKYKRWTVVPSRVLNAIPFGALLGADGKFLVEQVSIVTVPSSSIWVELARRSGLTGQSATLLGNPQLDPAKWEPLPDAEREVHEVGCMLEAAGFAPVLKVGPNATERAISAASGEVGILHIATHGEFPPDDAVDEHALMLAGNQRLRARDVRRLKLRACKLATVSICNGGLYRFGGGNEPLGMVPAFMIAGAENVLGPLWPVEDSIARLFMTEFYGALLEMSPAAAIQHASINFIHDNAELSQWAAFLLAGLGRRFTAPGTAAA